MARSSFNCAMVKSEKDRRPPTGGGKVVATTSNVVARRHEKELPPSTEMERGGRVDRLTDLAQKPRDTADLIIR